MPFIGYCANKAVDPCRPGSACPHLLLIDDVIAGIEKGHIARQGIVMVADKEARDGAHVVHGHEAVSSPSGR